MPGGRISGTLINTWRYKAARRDGGMVLFEAITDNEFEQVFGAEPAVITAMIEQLQKGLAEAEARRATSKATPDVTAGKPDATT